MKAIRIAASVLIASTSFVGIALVTQPAQAADKNTISIGPKNPISGEEFEAKGYLSTPVDRPVILQRKSNGKWVKADAGASTPSGFFRLHGKTSADRYFRVYAPKNDGKKAIYGKAKKVVLVGQKVTLTLTPSSVFGTKTVEAFIQVSPIREGRQVVLRVEEANGELQGVQNSHGRVKFKFSSAEFSNGTYHLFAKTLAANGASGKSSPSVAFKVTKPIITD